MSRETTIASDPTTYDVPYKHWKTTITIVDAKNGKELYSIQKNPSGDGRIIKDASGVDISHTTTHTTSSRIEVVMLGFRNNDKTFEVRDDRKMLGSPTYVSSAFSGQQMTWKNKPWSNKIAYTLIDGKGLALAKFESSPKTQVGKLEITKEVSSMEQIDEIALMILTLLRRKLQAAESATIAAVTA